jgi:purine-binding chemotaxis protein CheW
MIEEHDDVDSKARRRIMVERARRIAKPVAAPADNPDDLTIVVFRLGREQYALEAQFVGQIAKIAGVTRLPGLESAVLVNLHGEILSVLDLRKSLGIEQTALTKSSRVVVCGDGASRFGILADEVDQMARVGVASLAASTHPSDFAKCVRGLTGDGITVIDVAALAASSRMLFGSRARI